MVKQRNEHKSHFQVLFAEFLKVLSNSAVLFNTRMHFARICMLIATGLHRSERTALLHAQQIDDEFLAGFIHAIVQAGG